MPECEKKLWKKLGQASLTEANQTIVSPNGPASTIVVKQIILTNITAVQDLYSIYDSDTGLAGVSTANALFYSEDLAANTTAILDTEIVLDKDTQVLAASCDTESAINIAVYGYEILVEDAD